MFGLRTALSPALILFAVFAATLLGCDDDGPLPTENVFDIERGDAVFVEGRGFGALTLAFYAEEDLEVRAGSSIEYRLPVRGVVGPAGEVTRVDVESRLWLNRVIVTRPDSRRVVFDLNDVQHLGATLRLRLVGPIAQAAVPPR